MPPTKNAFQSCSRYELLAFRISEDRETAPSRLAVTVNFDACCCGIHLYRPQSCRHQKVFCPMGHLGFPSKVHKLSVPNQKLPFGACLGYGDGARKGLSDCFVT